LVAWYGWMRRTSTWRPSDPVSNHDTAEGPQSAEHRPDHEAQADDEGGADEDVVERRAGVLAVRIEAHVPSIAARWQDPLPDLICCSAVGPPPEGSEPRGDRRGIGMRLAAGLGVLGATMALTVGLVACSSGSAGPKPTNAQLAVGWQVYNDRCATCHGAKGGGGAGPKLAGTVVADFPNIGDQITVIENGKDGGAMPAWKGTLSAAEIEAVARYTRQCLGQPSC
jgi:mono/diheme cytochrome c family protein